MKKKWQKEINKVVKALRAYRPEKIVLFGSMLDPKCEVNDIDLLITKKTTLPRLSERARIARSFLPDQRIPVDFLIYTPQEIKREIERGNVFLAEILEKGKVLFDHEKTI